MTRNNPRGSGEKGTYGRIASNKDGGSKNQQQRRRSSNGSAKSSAAMSSGKSNGNGNGKPSPSSYSKKKKGPSGPASGKTNNSSNNNGKKKAVPKSKHHTAKPHRNSIKERVAAAAAASSKRRGGHGNGSSMSMRSMAAMMGGGNGPPRGAKRSNNSYGVGGGGGSGSASNSSKKKKKKKNRSLVRYRMSLSECNDEVYLQRADVPWFDAENEERFRENTPSSASGAAASYRNRSNDDDDDEDGYDISMEDQLNKKKKAGRNNDDAFQLPPESILQHLDDEIRTFAMYVRLTPSERQARLKFLEHVTELATDQFDNANNNNNSNNASAAANYYGDKGRRGYGGQRRGSSNQGGNNGNNNDNGKSFYLGQEGGVPASLNDFEDEEEIHVAPFGSFATQDVCTFASDVDMCLWGVVKGAKKKPDKNGMEFIGEDDYCSDSENEGEGGGEDDDDDDDCVVLESGPGCPLLTESSLLRTMDAIQSAASADLGNSTTQSAAAGKTEKEQSNAGGGLFFIDRVGEGGGDNDDDELECNADATKSIEVIDLSTTATNDEPTDGNDRKIFSRPRTDKSEDKVAAVDGKMKEEIGEQTTESNAQAVADAKRTKAPGSDDLKAENMTESAEGEQAVAKDLQADKAIRSDRSKEVGSRKETSIEVEDLAESPNEETNLSPPAEDKESPSLFQPSKIEWKKGCVISLNGLCMQTCSRECIRDVITPFLGVSEDTRDSGMYIDYSRGDASGYLRITEPMPEKFEELANKLNDGSILIANEKIDSAKILEGEEENRYWKNLADFLNGRKKKRFDDKERRRSRRERNMKRQDKKLEKRTRKKMRKSGDSHDEENEERGAAESKTEEVMLVRGGGTAGKNDEAMALDNDTTPSKQKDLEFVIDTQGVQELGGEMEDLTESHVDAAEPTTTSSPSTQHTEKTAEVDSPNNGEAEEKGVEESKFDDSNGQKQEDNLQGKDFEPGTSSGPGKSAENAIDINDDSEDGAENEVIVIDSDEDDDGADKMESYYSRTRSAALAPVKIKNAASADARDSPISLLYELSSTEAVEELADDDSIGSQPSTASPQAEEVLELSLTSNNVTLGYHGASIQRQPVKPTFGPTGKARIQVVSALQRLTHQLRKSNLTHTIECRSKARVPIINCSTRTGFEGDIAIGGHNGVDTSMYALSQVKRSHSFAPIVLLFKVLMAQQGLEKPFTGGLGSYKLYVLVAYHIECHLASGGSDRPSEILISLLIRYGCIETHNNDATSDLEQLRNNKEFISSGGGMCDLDPVFRLSDCVDMFRECHARLSDRILMVDDYGGDGTKISYLSSMIDCYRLREARETSDRRSKMCDTVRRTPIARNDSGKVNPGRRVGKVFSKSGGSSGPASNSNIRRSPRGAIVPKKRPDLQAKHSLRNNREAEALQRGTKNRKNKKKQNRDAVLRSFASRHSI